VLLAKRATAFVFKRPQSAESADSAQHVATLVTAMVNVVGHDVDRWAALYHNSVV